MMRIQALGMTAALLVACGPRPGMIGDPSMFDPDWILEVHIEMDPDDFEESRVEARNFEDVFCADTPPPNPYTYFPADITIDGITVRDVGVRKKGFFGSVNPDTPSFKVSFNEYVGGQRFYGMRRMTLNNAISDGAKIKQCIGYMLFDRGGVMSPRCNFAHVKINDEDMGLYVHLESIKTELLGRYFDDTRGNLYEGALSDFQPDWIGTFQRKTNQENPDRSDLHRMLDACRPENVNDGTACEPGDRHCACAAEGAEYVSVLESLIDLDSFYDFWAMEVIIAHWDGYASFNHNNYYLYANPETGKFHFIPWGIDGILFSFGDDDQRSALFNESVIANRLYNHPETQQVFVDRVRAKLDDKAVWDEDFILSEIDRMEELVTPIGDPYDDGRLGQEIEGVREFVRTYPDQIRAELDAPPASVLELADPPCFRQLGTVEATFETTWGSLQSANPFEAGTGTWQVIWNDLDDPDDTPVTEVSTAVAAAAGLVQPPEGGPPKYTVQIFAVIPGAPNDTFALAGIDSPDPGLLNPGATPVGFTDGAFGIMFTADPAVEGSDQIFLIMTGELENGDPVPGEIVFEEAGTTSGATVKGSLQGGIFETGW